jgi:tryptophan synthase alpha chain
VKTVTSLPVAVGFGISAPEQARWVASFADAVVVGSALADIIERHSDPGTLPEQVESFVARLKRGMGGAGPVRQGTAHAAGPGSTRLRGKG